MPTSTCVEPARGQLQLEQLIVAFLNLLRNADDSRFAADRSRFDLTPSADTTDTQTVRQK